MARYDYRCKDENCRVVREHIQPIANELPALLACPKCGGPSEHVILSAPSVATSGMSQSPLDVVIGRDAESRWADIHRRQEARDKVRQASGETDLVMTGRNQFSPAAPDQKQLRADAVREAEQRGKQTFYDNPTDKRLVE